MEAKKRRMAKTHWLYRRWTAMRTRCSCGNRCDSKYYHDKGIKVCDEWSDFWSYVEWWDGQYIKWYMHNEPMFEKSRLEVDRINGNGDYCPENCRLVTHRVNMNNTCKSKRKAVH